MLREITPLANAGVLRPAIVNQQPAIIPML